MMVDLGLLAHHTAPVVGCFFNGSSSVAKLVTPVAALLLRKMLRKLDLKHGEAHAAQRLAAKLRPRVMLLRPIWPQASRAAEARGWQLQWLVGQRASHAGNPSAPRIGNLSRMRLHAAMTGGR